MLQRTAWTIGNHPAASIAREQVCRRPATESPPRLPPRSCRRLNDRSDPVLRTYERQRDLQVWRACAQSRTAEPAGSACACTHTRCRRNERRRPPSPVQWVHASDKEGGMLRNASWTISQMPQPRRRWTSYWSRRESISSPHLPSKIETVVHSREGPSSQSILCL